jgi:integrase
MSVRQVNGVWRAFAAHKGKRKSIACDSEEHARTVEAQLLAELGRINAREHVPKDGTMASLLNTCIMLDWNGKSDAMPKIGKGIVAYFGPDSLPIDITEQSIDKFVAWLREHGKEGKGCSNGTINRYLSGLRIMLKRAQRLRLINTIPLFPESRLLPEAEPRELVLRPEWLAALMDELERRENREAARLTAFLYHVGCRISEALALTWERVDLETGKPSILFTRTKGKKARRIPIPKAIRPMLASLPSRGYGERLFTMPYPTFQRQYNDARDSVCDRLGLSDEIRKQWVIHTLRHTCLTNLASKGWSGPQIQAWGGHQSMAITQRYVHGSAIDLFSMVDT